LFVLKLEDADPARRSALTNRAIGIDLDPVPLGLSFNGRPPPSRTDRRSLSPRSLGIEREIAGPRVIKAALGVFTWKKPSSPSIARSSG